MSIFAIGGGILCFIVIVAFMLFGKEPGVGGSWSFSFPSWKMPKWITFNGFLKLILAVFVTYFIIGLGYEGRYFWQPREYTSRFQIIEGTKMIAYIIPKVPPEFENEIILTKPIGFLFGKGDEPEVFFPGTKLIQSHEGNGDALGRRFGNFLFGQDNKEPEAVFKDSVTASEQAGNTKDVVIFGRGDRFVFSKREEHKIYVMSASLGDMLHLNYRIVERKF